jgi:hypothetical protein
MIGFEPLFHHAYLPGERVDRFLTSKSSAMRQALEQFDQVTDTYAAESEAHLRELVDSGQTVLSTLREEGALLSHELDHYVERSEARVARWIEWLSRPISVLWRRFMRWYHNDRE